MRINDMPTLKISKCENRIVREFDTDQLELAMFLENHRVEWRA